MSRGYSVAKRYDGVICKVCDDQHSQWRGGGSFKTWSFKLAAPSDCQSQFCWRCFWFVLPLGCHCWCFVWWSLFCFVGLFVFLSFAYVGGEVGKDGVQSLGFVFPPNVLHNSYFSSWFVFSVSCTQQRGDGIWLLVSTVFDLRIFASSKGHCSQKSWEQHGHLVQVKASSRIFGLVSMAFKMSILWELLELPKVVTSSVVIQLLPENWIDGLHKGDMDIKDYPVIQQVIRSIRYYEL